MKKSERLVRVQLKNGKSIANTEAIYDEEKGSYACSFPGQIIRAWEPGIFGKELPVPDYSQNKPAEKS